MEDIPFFKNSSRVKLDIRKGRQFEKTSSVVNDINSYLSKYVVLVNYVTNLCVQYVGTRRDGQSGNEDFHRPSSDRTGLVLC